MCKVIASFRFIRCNYKKHDNPEYFLYESHCFCLSLYHQTESEQWGDAGQTSSQKHLVFSDSMASTRPCQQNGWKDQAFGAWPDAALQRKRPSSASLRERENVVTEGGALWMCCWLQQDSGWTSGPLVANLIPSVWTAVPFFMAS